MYKYIKKNFLKLNKKIIFLLGPTGSGKTNISIQLAKKYPIDIISLDSAMIYCEMNIGTGKPSNFNLQTIPHQLINICSPKEIYSLFCFYQYSVYLIYSSLKNNRIPMFVGGTIMYFNISGVYSWFFLLWASYGFL